MPAQSGPGGLTEVCAASLAVAAATSATNPLDVLKVEGTSLSPALNFVQVRLQLQRLREPQSVAKTVTGLVRNEGALVFFSGLPAALTRAMVYGGLRFGTLSIQSDILT